jgi:predicted alpha/beta hydrolase family esterase
MTIMKNLNDFLVLVLPGRDGSGADHWQTLWEQAFPDFVRVEQSDWIHPVYADWSDNLTLAVSQAPKPVLLIAHSLGTSLTMRWASEQPALSRKIAGAFLVAPSDRDVMEGKPDNPVKGFGPMLLQPLPFPAVVTASQNDPLVSFDRARTFASAWRAGFVDAGLNGHLGSAANLGLWPQGLLTLGQFLETI